MRLGLALFDVIGGTSAGSMVSSLYAIGYKPEEIFDCFKKNYNKIVGKSFFPLNKMEGLFIV